MLDSEMVALYEAQHRRNFQFSCEEFGLPVKEPTWLILWGWS